LDVDLVADEVNEINDGDIDILCTGVDKME